MTSLQVGTSLGLIAGIGGAAGTLASGYLADRLGVRSPKWYFRVPALGALIGVPFAAIAILSNDTVVALSALAVVKVCYSAFLAPSIAITHNLVPPNMRAFSSAVLFFVLNFIGLGFGPLVIGLVSDLLEPTFGIYALRWAMLITIVAVVMAIGMYFKASRYVDQDLEKF